MDWISIKEKLPEPETEVLICAEVRDAQNQIYRVITTAMYEDGTIYKEDSSWVWEDIENFAIYDSEKDDYIIPRGWWEERHYNDGDTLNQQVDDLVTHWMPLPDTPKVVNE